MCLNAKKPAHSVLTKEKLYLCSESAAIVKLIQIPFIQSNLIFKMKLAMCLNEKRPFIDCQQAKNCVFQICRNFEKKTAHLVLIRKNLCAPNKR